MNPKQWKPFSFWTFSTSTPKVGEAANYRPGHNKNLFSFWTQYFSTSTPKAHPKRLLSVGQGAQLQKCTEASFLAVFCTLIFFVRKLLYLALYKLIEMGTIGQLEADRDGSEITSAEYLTPPWHQFWQGEGGTYFTFALLVPVDLFCLPCIAMQRQEQNLFKLAVGGSSLLLVG